MVQVKVVTAGWHSNLVVRIPLTIGTVPIGKVSENKASRQFPFLTEQNVVETIHIFFTFSSLRKPSLQQKTTPGS